MPPTPGGGAEWLPSPVKFSAVLVPWVDVAVTKFLVDLVENGVFVIRCLREWTRKAKESSYKLLVPGLVSCFILLAVAADIGLILLFCFENNQS